MTDEERQALADLIRTKRQELDISSRELARRAGIDQAWLTRIDQKQIDQPKMATLQAVARALELPVSDFYAVTNGLPADELPSLRPYMRAKYSDLSPEALAEVEDFIATHSRTYRGAPRPGEDEIY